MTATVEGPGVAPAASMSTRLRERTRRAHETAENSPFVANLMSGRYPLEAYTLLASQHRAIYAALEDAGDAFASDEVAGPFVVEELRRSPAIRADLQVLLGPVWETVSRGLVLPATARYVEHLRTVTTASPASFVAHHYVRYLGDLSGGQIVRRRLNEVFGPAVAGATGFYDFGLIPKVKPFRDAYRRKLDAIGLDRADSDQLVAEAVSAFQFNHAVFLDLGERCATLSTA